MHTCAYCGRRLLWFHRVVGQLRFCSREHARLHGIRGGAADAGAASGAGTPLANGDACPTDSTAEEAHPERTAPPGSGTCGPSGDCELGDAPDPPLEDAPGRVDPGLEPAGCNLGESAADGAGVLEGYGDIAVALGIDEPGGQRIPDCQDMLPLPAAAPVSAGDAGLCWMPPRPPRRRIIVPTHRPPQTARELPLADGLPPPVFLHPLKPPARQRGPMPQSLCPVFQAATPAMAGRAHRRMPESGLRGASEKLAPVAGGPVAPAGRTPAPRLHPLWMGGGVSAPSSSPSGPRRLGPVAVSQISAAFFSLPAPGRDKRLSLAGQAHAGIQPFRMHRPAQRPLRLRPGLTLQPAPLPGWPPPARSNVSDLLFVPRPTAMPLRPSYAFGPPPGGEAVAADASGVQAARQGPLMPPGKIARG